MTVRELIKILSEMPPRAKVLYRAFSDYQVLDKDEVALVLAKEKVIALRDGHYMDVKHAWIDPKVGEPEWVTVVVFPGN